MLYFTHSTIGNIFCVPLLIKFEASETFQNPSFYTFTTTHRRLHFSNNGGSQPSDRDLLCRNLHLQRLRRLFCRVCTIPLDTAKVRLQLQKRAVLGEDSGVGTSKDKGLLGTVASIAQEEGLLALWKGIISGLHLQFIYGGLRIGLYEPVKAFCAGGNILGEVSLF